MLRVRSIARCHLALGFRARRITGKKQSGTRAVSAGEMSMISNYSSPSDTSRRDSQMNVGCAAYLCLRKYAHSGLRFPMALSSPFTRFHLALSERERERERERGRERVKPAGRFPISAAHGGVVTPVSLSCPRMPSYLENNSRDSREVQRV